MKRLLVTATALIGLAAAAPMANATTILTFGEALGGDPISATVTAGVTTISATNAEVTVTSIIGSPALIAPQFFTLDATSVAPATSVGGFITQAFSGSFSITAGAQNILSGTFTDEVFGAGTSLTLSVSNSTPGESVTFTSNVIPADELGAPDGFSLSFADVAPAARTTPLGCSGTPGCTIRPFTSSVSGTASASEVPEPATLGLLGVGLLGIAALRRRR